MSPRHSDKLCCDCKYFLECKTGRQWSKCGHPAVRSLIDDRQDGECGEYCTDVRRDKKNKYLCGRIGYWWEPRDAAVATKREPIFIILESPPSRWELFRRALGLRARA